MNDKQSRPAKTEARRGHRIGLRAYLALLGVAALLIFILGLALRLSRRGLRIDPKTTFITEPLTADGTKVDYLAAIEQASYPPNLATEENGYRLILERFGPDPEAEPDWITQVCPKLGLDAGRIRADLKFTDPYDWIHQYVVGPDFDDDDRAAIARLADESAASLDLNAAWNMAFLVEERMRDAPWTLSDLPMMERWLAENGPALDLIGEAVRKPVYCIPLVRDHHRSLVGSQFPEVQRSRAFARALSARAQFRIGSGDIDGAIDDIVSCKRLGRHVGLGASTYDLFVGCALQTIADGIGLAAAPEHPPSRQQLQRLLAAPDELPPYGELARVYRPTRFVGLDVIQILAHDEDPGRSLDEIVAEWGASEHLPKEMRFAIDVMGVDWNVVAEKFNTHYDAAIKHGTVPSASGFRPGLLFSMRARSEFTGDLLSALLIPGVESIEEATHRLRCSDNLQHIALAMLLYERDHGTLPPAFTVSAQGVPLHSWRVLLLPYLGFDAIYQRIRLDEPWDSEHNRKRHTTNVSCYRCPSAVLADGETTYAVIVGKEAPFDQTGQGRRLSDLGPGYTKRILVAERKLSTCWMDPGVQIALEDARRGINVDPKGISSNHPLEANFGVSSGAARFLNENANLEEELFPLLGHPK